MTSKMQVLSQMNALFALFGQKTQSSASCSVFFL